METAPAQGEDARERGTRPVHGPLPSDAARPAADPPSGPTTDAHDGGDPASEASPPRREGIPAGPRWWRWWG